MNCKKLLSIGKTANILGVHIDTLREWDRDEKLVPVKTPGGHRRYRLEDIEAFCGEVAEKKDDEKVVATYAKISYRSDMKNIKIDIGEIDCSLLKTDEDIRNEAKKRLDHVLVGIGEASGKEMWVALKKNGMFKPDPDNKTFFVRKAGQEHKKKATLQERKNTEDMIFQTIKEMKQQFEATGSQTN